MTGTSANRAVVSVLARLHRALKAGTAPTLTLLQELGLVADVARELQSEALGVLSHATSASSTELELALGVLLALRMPANVPERAP